MCRTPIKVKRTPITVITDNGYNSGGWGVIPPHRMEPFDAKVPKNSKMMWCPYCGEWNIYTPKDGTLMCTGWCGWGSSSEFYTKYYNNNW